MKRDLKKEGENAKEKKGRKTKCEKERDRIGRMATKNRGTTQLQHE